MDGALATCLTSRCATWHTLTAELYLPKDLDKSAVHANDLTGIVKCSWPQSYSGYNTKWTRIRLR